MTKTEIYVNKDKTLNKEQEQCYKKALIKRAKNEPVQYIIGKAEFMGLTFMLNSATLIPRPDTETLVEICIDKIKKNKYKFVLDLACGSGAIGISIAKYCKDVFVACSDIDKDAVSMSIKNAKLKDLRDRIGYVPQKGLLFSGTIASNLKLGNENLTAEELLNAAKVSQSLEFIENKANKFESEISQGGTNVSGGQKQRLSIARAIAKNP